MKTDRWLLASIGDPQDATTWSGIPYHLLQEISKSRTVITVDIGLPRIGELALKGAQWTRNLFGHRRYTREREAIRLQWMASALVSAVEQARPAVCLALTGLPVAYLPPLDVPMVVWSDATFCGLVDYYPAATGLSPRSLRNGHIAEATALARADLTLLSSRWAADFARNHYAHTQSIGVLPFGANILSPPRAYDSWPNANRTCVVLSIGVDYLRKGIDRVIGAARYAERVGQHMQVHIVGVDGPPQVSLPGNVVWHGSLSKEAGGPLEKLFENADIFTMLSRADCTPMVVSEAFAYGLPVVASSTGGLSEMVADAGYLVDETATPADIVDAWREAARLRDEGLGALARMRYEATYNWPTAVASLLQKVESRSFNG
jgi:glycosyltransferase involved in cell wall biosynthesis